MQPISDPANTIRLCKLRAAPGKAAKYKQPRRKDLGGSSSLIYMKILFTAFATDCGHRRKSFVRQPRIHLHPLSLLTSRGCGHVCSISSMVSEGGSLERDFGIPVSDSASVVSTGMASDCSLQLYTLCQSPPRKRVFSLSRIFFCPSHPPTAPLLRPFFWSSLGKVKRLPPTPAPFLLGEEARPQFITITTRQHRGGGCGLQYLICMERAGWLLSS